MDYTKDYIIDQIDEPEVEELYPEPAIEELIWDEGVDEILKNPDGAYRKKVAGYPLDHKVLCDGCGFKGIIGFRQIFCPRCSKVLIPPNEVQDLEVPYTPRQRPAD